MLNSVNHLIENNLHQNIERFGVKGSYSQWLVAAVLIVGILVLSTLSYYLARFFIFRFVSHLSKKGRLPWIQSAYKFGIFHLISYFFPLFILYVSAPILILTPIPYASLLSNGIQKFIVLYSIFIFARLLFAVLSNFEERYQHLTLAKLYSIKSYIQVAKIIIVTVTLIFMISVLVNQSPAYFLTGLGAMTAIILLVFKDSILGFITSIQLAAHDIVRLGDWIEVNGFGADGTVIDISLTTMKIKNFDNSVVTLPSYALLSNGVKNWRGMNEAGGRRVKRSVAIDVNSVKFCSDSMLERLNKISILKSRLTTMINEYENNSHQQEIVSLLSVDGKPITNLSAFKAYLEAYLSSHPRIHKGMTFIIRQLQDEGKGIPVELYLFYNDTNWSHYENFQFGIFDHIYAVLPLFDLRTFQQRTNG